MFFSVLNRAPVRQPRPPGDARRLLLPRVQHEQGERHRDTGPAALLLHYAPGRLLLRGARAGQEVSE